jgi:hypothetical protein
MPDATGTSSSNAGLVVAYSRAKIALASVALAALSAWWAWHGLGKLRTAADPTLGAWLAPALGLTLAFVFILGAWSMSSGATEILRLGARGIFYPEVYDAIVPWSAVANIARVPGRGVAFEVMGGERFGRNPTRNLRAANWPGAPDVVIVRTAMLDRSARSLAAAMEQFRRREERPGSSD